MSAALKRVRAWLARHARSALSDDVAEVVAAAERCAELERAAQNALEWLVCDEPEDAANTLREALSARAALSPKRATSGAAKPRLENSDFPTFPNPFPDGTLVEWVHGRGWVPFVAPKRAATKRGRKRDRKVT